MASHNVPAVTSLRGSTLVLSRPTIGAITTAKHALPGEHVAGIGRSIAHIALQPLRGHHHRREERAVDQRHRDHREGEAAMREDAQVHHRLLGGQLPHDEEGEADQRRDPQRLDLPRAEPVVVAPDVQHDLERADPHDQQDQPDIIDLRLLRRRLDPAQQHDRAGDADHRDRDVDEEDPVPRPIVADRAAQQRPGDRRDPRWSSPTAPSRCRAAWAGRRAAAGSA